MKKDRFTQLVDDLVDGKLTLTHVQIAIRAYVKQSKNIPEEVKDLLAGKDESNAGLIYSMMRPISQAIGTVELAYLRGKQSDEE